STHDPAVAAPRVSTKRRFMATPSEARGKGMTTARAGWSAPRKDEPGARTARSIFAPDRAAPGRQYTRRGIRCYKEPERRDPGRSRRSRSGLVADQPATRITVRAGSA